MTDADWRRLVRTGSVATEEGYQLACEPSIAQNVRRFWLISHFNLCHY